MQNVKRYSGMLATIVVIVVAGYAGMAAGTTCALGPCNAYFMNGSLAGSANYGCCVDETNDHGAMVIECDKRYTKCKVYWANNTLILECD